ncbi:MAG TPA: hypothetical protein VNW99_00505 [Cytophagaceae bacterium]|jgi:hypothetical protein|nr:hypothetical protein [Cytophagaceae bacterium]
MALDKSIADQMLDPFRGMVKDLQTRNLKGQEFNELNELLQKMEQYAASMDIMEFTTKMVSDGLFTNFSEKYSKAIISASQNQ